MTPDQLAKTNSEHAHQRAFFAWLALARIHGYAKAKQVALGTALYQVDHTKPYLPGLSLFHAIPNGGGRSKAQAAMLKAEGVKAGVLDTFLPIPSGKYHGLYIEFKEPKRRNHRNGGLSAEQQLFAAEVSQYGYYVATAYTWREAANCTMQYLGSDVRFTL